MSFYGASAQQLTTAAGYCEDTATYIEGMRQRVAEISQGLKWQGGAYTKFAGAMVQWDGDFHQLIRNLESIYDRLNIAAGTYKNAEDQSMDLSGSLIHAGDSGRIDQLINANLPR